MEYDVIESYCLIDLINKVNCKLENGWTPQGSLTHDEMIGYNGERYLQAIIKAERKS